ncbi:PREDICTED: huntingtin [Elephantulus edwardii]|uniref:huntingtin n=1 Tax=Elephantulus edwardii TaxID=28737 RepID=UPI0003F0DB46|nr:PREDICTED: huntingtin [Elephantulus edwardii]
MATLEKLMKAFESLKSFQQQQQQTVEGVAGRAGRGHRPMGERGPLLGVTLAWGVEGTEGTGAAGRVVVRGELPAPAERGGPQTGDGEGTPVLKVQIGHDLPRVLPGDRATHAQDFPGQHPPHQTHRTLELSLPSVGLAVHRQLEGTCGVSLPLPPGTRSVHPPPGDPECPPASRGPGVPTQGRRRLPCGQLWTPAPDSTGGSVCSWAAPAPLPPPGPGSWLIPSSETQTQRKKELLNTKKDRVNHCQTICENIVAQSLRNSPEFQKLLGIAVELFLLCSDDAESDVRMVADECLNKVIKALMDSNLPRLQLELYKEIKKNGAPRSLRAALWRFAELAHLVRPQKCRPYLVNLLPCLTRISKRTEESVQESLAAAIPKIMASFGNFANDNEIKVLLKAFIANLKSSSPTIRRTAASSAVSVCQHSRRTQHFYSWLLSVLLGLLVPVGGEPPTLLILGVLLALRYLVPLLQQQVKDTSLKGSFGVTRKETEVSPSTEQLVQVYELILHYTQHPDHNVVTGALELLQQIFRTPPPELLQVLTTVGGGRRLGAARDEPGCRSRSGSIVELIAGGGSSCSPVLSRKQKGKVLLGEEEALEDDSESRSDVSSSAFAASVKGEVAGELAASSGVSTPGSTSSAADSVGHDIITEQPRSQHTLQSDPVDLASCDLASAATDGDEEDILSHSSSQISAVPSDPAMDLNDGTQASSPISDSSQTTTEGPDSAVTPSDSSEIVLDSADSQYSGMQMEHLQDEEEDAAGVLTDEASVALPHAHALRNAGHSRQSSDSSVERLLPKEEAAELGDPESKPCRIKGDIGQFTDDDAAPLVHCVRLLAASFLLTGEKNALVPDRDARVSVKALAVSCVGAAVALHPESFFSKLYKSPLDPVEYPEEQYVSDILNYIDHGDPQIRGATAILCGTLVHSILTRSRFHVSDWLGAMRGLTGNTFSLVDCVPLLQKTLKDESSVTCKLACTAVRLCVMSLCSSSYSELGLQLIIDALPLRSSSYWLVRTELLETLAEIDFRLVSFLESRAEKLHRGAHHYTGLLKLQERVLNNVVISLLGDEDSRVRHVAAASLLRLVPKLFYKCDQGQADPVVAVARDQSSVYLKLLMHEMQPPSHFSVSTMTRIYRGYSLLPSITDVTLENNLSRVIAAVSHQLVRSTTRALTFGCCEALCLLSTAFPVCVWSLGWHCGVPPLGGADESRKSCTVGMVTVILTLLSSAWFPLDLSAHQDALTLAGNLLAASAPRSLRSSWSTEEEASTAATRQEEAWPALGDRSLVPMVEQLFSHLLKVINICAHVLDDVAPGPAVKAALPSLTNPPSLSPIRRKGKEKEAGEQVAVPLSPKKGPEAGPASRQPDTPGPATTSKSSTLGGFYHLPSYLKLYEVLKATHTNYKVTLDLQSSTEKFGSFLRSALDVLSQILELATLQDIGKCVEEILGYLKSCFSREPMMATVCVQQLLKTLFGTNLASQFDGLSSNPSKSQGRAQRLGSSSIRPGLYHYCFMAPYTHFTQALADASLRNMVQAEQDHDTSGWFDVLQKVSSQLKTNLTGVTKNRADKNAIHNHIRLFEPLVIKALKQYTTTTSVQLQRQVLDLLAQLVQLRVNYCLLDSDQVFIGFVLKQFEYIEVGQFRESEAIIPNVFFFLVLLSYERYHSKQIIGIPKIIQLCDGIMASGRKAVTHAIPALQPIVHDLFVLRGANKADAGKELETQKEVVVSMLLRLIQHHQVLEMFILVLQQCHKENEDKWKRLSRQVADVILPMLAKQQMHIDSHEALGVLNTLFEILAPSSLRPVDMLLRSMFVTPSTMASVSTVQLWISGILAILRVLISQSTEDIVLSRIQELSFSAHLLSCPVINRLREGSSSPAPEGHSEGRHGKSLPEETFSRFLLQLVGILLDDIVTKQLRVDVSEQQHTFYCQELGTLLMCLVHIFKSGMFRRMTAAATRLFTSEASDGSFYTLEGLNAHVRAMVPTHPALVLLWCQLLLLVNYTDYRWWAEVQQTPKRHSLSSTKLLSPQALGEADSDWASRLGMCNREIVRRGALILFCDYVCQNLHDSEHLTWLTVNHIQDLISLSHEPPVQDFISAVHRNSAASGLFIQAIQSRCDNLSTPTMLRKTLQCLEGIHLSQSGAVLTLYVDRLLHTPFRVLARRVDTLACRRVEMLLAANTQSSVSQLPLEELNRIQEYLQSSGLAQRHQRLYSLLDRFRLSTVPESQSPAPPVTSHPLDGDGHMALEAVNPDKDWYIRLVRSQCWTRSDSALLEGAELVHRIPAGELEAFMMNPEFNISLLAPCLSLGVRELSGGQGSPLFETARLVTLHRMSSVVQQLPATHQPYQPSFPPESSAYWSKLSDLFGDATVYQSLTTLARALAQYLVVLSRVPSHLHLPPEKEEDVVKFVVMTLEALSWHLIHRQMPLSLDLQAALDCCCVALQLPGLWLVLSSLEFVTHACSLIHCVRFALEAIAVQPGDQLLSPERRMNPAAALREDRADADSAPPQYVTTACELVAEMVEALQSVLAPGHRRNSNVPAFLTSVLKNIVVSLARLPLVNSYTRVPPLVWKLGWSPKPGGDFGTALPEIPVEFLQEKEVFKEFIYRINTLGWTSRTQFEETWATLLGVLVTQPLSMEQEESQPEEDTERTQIHVLAVQAITSLVLSAMAVPVAGNPAVSCLEQQPRNKPLKALDTRFGRKLSVIRGIVEQEVQAMVSKRDNIATHHSYQAWDPVPSLAPATTGALISHDKLLLQINPERELGNMSYKLGQVSIHSVWLGNSITPLREEEWDEEEEEEADVPLPSSPPTSPVNSRKHRAGVDIHSCSQFLLELYSRWLLPSGSARKTPVILISEVVRSLLVVSDLFTERNQFEMMYSTLMELRRVHPSEDEILVQYLVPATCKAAAVLGMDKAVAEPVSRLLESALRSSHLPSRLGALHGVLYVLECDLLDDTAKQLIPVVSDYLLSNLKGIAHCVNVHSQQHVLLMCATAFYLIENYPLDVGPEFSASIIQMCGVMLSGSEEATPSAVFHCVLRGLERLLLSEQLSRLDAESLVKLSVDRVNVHSPHRAMAALGLMLTCMYTGKEKVSPGRTADPNSSAPDSESVIVAMERVSVLFDRIRKGFPCEARVVARILPQFLDDFFPPQDVMNKVIGEFLSNQQPYPQFMATVVYKVFQTLHSTGQSSMVRDWVMLSLSNFTQRTPVAMAMWSLSCFFVSASTSPWVSAVLPHVISRMGKLEPVDVNLFCLVATDFYRHQIEEELDRRAFQSVFEVVAAPGSPYHRLLACLRGAHQGTTG